MITYTLKRLKLEVEYEDGTPGWFEIQLDPDTRTVVVGMDALGAAGTHDLPASRGLYPIPQTAFDATAEQPSEVEVPAAVVAGGGHDEAPGAGFGGLPHWLRRRIDVKRSAVRGVTQDQHELRALMMQETPNICEYRNGKWYCWPT